MNGFFKYLKTKVIDIIIYFVVFAFFFITFYLYSFPLAAVLYPAALGFVFSLILFFVDYSHKKKLKKELKEINNNILVCINDIPEPSSEIEAEYQEMVKNIHTELRRVSDKAHYKYKDMIDYYTIWVHQIKTPIASMSLKLQSEDTPFSRALSQDLFRIEQYVEMVLTYLRLDSDDSDYLITKQNLSGIVKGACKKYMSEFIDRKIKLTMSDIDKVVLTDIKWLSFVIEQLLSNALKYTNAGGEIKIYLNEAGKLVIEDNGIGIRAEDLPRIFERGYTGFNGRMDKKASGIGLYLCKRICIKLGHTIEAESTPGVGTRFLLGLEISDVEIE